MCACDILRPEYLFPTAQNSICIFLQALNLSIAIADNKMSVHAGLKLQDGRIIKFVLQGLPHHLF